MSIGNQPESGSTTNIFDRMREGCGVATDSQLAAALDAPVNTLKTWRRRGSIPANVLTEFARRYDLSLDWIYHGIGNKNRERLSNDETMAASHKPQIEPLVQLTKYKIGPIPKPQAPISNGNLFNEFVIVPRYTSDGLVPSNGVALKRSYLEKRNANAFKLAAMDIVGDSMSPTLFDGDTVVFDLDDTVVTVDDIYLFELEGFRHIKRLRRMPGNKIEIISDNSKYQPFIISERDPQTGFIVRGRFFWRGGSQI